MKEESETEPAFPVHYAGFIRLIRIKVGPADKTLEKVNSLVYLALKNRLTGDYKTFTVKAYITSPITPTTYSPEYERVLRAISDDVRRRMGRYDIIILGLKYLGRSYDNFDGWPPGSI